MLPRTTPRFDSVNPKLTFALANFFLQIGGPATVTHHLRTARYHYLCEILSQGVARVIIAVQAPFLQDGNE